MLLNTQSRCQFTKIQHLKWRTQYTWSYFFSNDKTTHYIRPLQKRLLLSGYFSLLIFELRSSGNNYVLLEII